jgi:hypothetical protein
MRLPRRRPAVTNAVEPHRCPGCDSAVFDVEPPRGLVTYACGWCGERFTCWPKMAALLPDHGALCSAHRDAPE